jgi:hypothetical protein
MTAITRTTYETEVSASLRKNIRSWIEVTRLWHPERSNVALRVCPSQYRHDSHRTTISN